MDRAQARRTRKKLRVINVSVPMKPWERAGLPKDGVSSRNR